MKYSFDDIKGVPVDVDLSSTDHLTLSIGGGEAVLDPMDVGVLFGLLNTWFTRGGYPA